MTQHGDRGTRGSVLRREDHGSEELKNKFIQDFLQKFLLKFHPSMSGETQVRSEHCVEASHDGLTDSQHSFPNAESLGLLQKWNYAVNPLKIRRLRSETSKIEDFSSQKGNSSFSLERGVEVIGEDGRAFRRPSPLPRSGLDWLRGKVNPLKKTFFDDMNNYR